MAADDYVIYLQDFDSEVNHRQAVHIGMNDEIGDVAMYKDLTRSEADDRICRDAAVRASDPKVFRTLADQPGPQKSGDSVPSPVWTNAYYF